jgi:glycosyltransferase involved in cell wall biosynthesis
VVVKVVFLTREAMPEGGLSLASFRLAAALTEAGHEAEVIYSHGEPPTPLARFGRRVSSDAADFGVSAPRLGRELERAAPSVVLVGSGRRADLRAAGAVAPTALHAHLHYGVCADHGRYWSRLGRSCGVRAGRHCTALRPLLGCSDLRQSLDPSHVSAQREMLGELAGGGTGVVCVSSDQARLYADHGVPETSIAVVPNLGLRATAAELEAACRQTPEGWRDATAFLGRLSKPKGAQLLDALARSLPPDARPRIFGEGYLHGRLAASLPSEVLCGHIPQDAVLGVLMWARAVVFPSLWPEPGGIVGVDAQLAGVPLAAFDVGAARHWPAAKRFPPGDTAAMAAWLADREPRERPRDPDAIAEAQARYWTAVAEWGAEALGQFASGGRFEPEGVPPAERLIEGPRGVLA